MKGFLKRDCSLLFLASKGFLPFLLLFFVLGFFFDKFSALVPAYLMGALFSFTVVPFNYDELNHWTSYAAAVPNGRRNMVRARYLLSLGLTAAASLFLLALDVPNHTVQVDAVLLRGGLFLLYIAVILPVSFRFGATKSRFFIMLLLMGVAVAGVYAFQSASLDFPPASSLLRLLPVLVLSLGAAAVAGSYLISCRIMDKKEF